MADHARSGRSQGDAADIAVLPSILETEFTTDSGVVRLIDFMPIRGTEPDVVRIVEGRHRRSRDADGADRPLRLRVDRPMGPPGRRCVDRDGRARQPVAEDSRGPAKA